MNKGILCDDVRIWNERNAFFYMENSAGEQYQISKKLYYQLIYVDQTNNIPCDEDFPVKWLQKMGFISTSRLIKQSMFVRRWIVAYIGVRGRSLSPICHAINKILPFLAIVMLVSGIVASAMKRTPFIWYDAIWIHIIGIKRVCVWMKKLTNDLDSILPLVRFQSAARTWRVKRGDFGTELKKKLDDRRCGYIGCLDSSMDVKSIQQWCIKQELMMSNKGTVREYEMFKNIVASFMKEINELDEIPSIYYSSQFEELVYKDDKTEIPISKLSAGYQSLLWMIMDLAYRVCLLNPELESREQVTGIVLIDEIDLHLHPKWQ